MTSCLPAASVVSRLRPGMGTFIAVEAQGPGADSRSAGVDAAFGAIALVERIMHPHRAGSDLAALSARASAEPLEVHPWTWETLALCRRLHDDSDGVFDPCLPGSRGGFEDLELRPGHCVVTHAPLALDLGGIAKGFAVDRALEALRAAGCESGLVNAGGDLAVFGRRPREVVCRRGDDRTRLVALHNAALATSEPGGETAPREHRGYYDGRGRRAPSADFAAVAAPSAALADGLTKCLLAGDPRTIAALLLRYGAQGVDWGDTV